jgi:hypothetical protein
MRPTPRQTLTGLAWLTLGFAILDLAARALARRGLFGEVGTDHLGLTATVAIAAGVLLMVAARPSRRRVFAAFALAFAIGATCQLHLGARLQSDGFYYFAYLRSLWFDHDVNFLNDYRVLGLTDKPYLFEPTSTGHAPSAWTIGPAIVWSPFFGIGHLVASRLSATSAVAVDGTSFPYRQAVCLAGLFYGLLGVYFCMRLAALFTARRVAAAAAAIAVSGSFMLWYLIREPTMTHAPSMAAVAAFAWLWAATLRRRLVWQWIALGALGGLMALIRWQSAIYGWLPLCEVAAMAVGLARQRDRDGLRRLTVGAAAGAAAAIIAFLPQMLAWKAIYGSYIAVSPLGPQIRFADPHFVDVLWSSRNGLFALSPVLYAGAIGLPILIAIKRHRLAGIAFLSSFVLMVYFNSIIQDWWGSAGFGGRRFDGAIALLAVGLAVAIDATRRLVARAPMLPAAAVIGAAILWNATFRASASAGVFDAGQPNDFGAVAADQVATIEGGIGHPFSYPANLGFAIWNGVPPAAYDLLAPGRFLSDPARPYGRIDFGAPGDEVFLGDGFFGAESDGPASFRWVTSRAAFILPLARTTKMRVQLRLRAFSYPGAPPQQLTVRLNDTPLGPFDVPADWQTIAFVVERAVWRTTINRIALEFSRADAPADHDTPGDRRRLAAAIDFLRIDPEAAK